MKLKLLLSFFVYWLAIPTVSQSQSFSGRVTTSFYAYQRSDTINVSSQQSRAYQGFQFAFRQKNFLFRSFGQVDHDLSSPLAGDAKVRLYNIYFQWQNMGHRAELKIGRQPIFGGVAVGTIDGVQLKVKIAKWLRLKTFAGGLMPASQKVKLINNLDNNYLAGAQFRILPRANIHLSLSYFTKRQKRPGYNTLRSDSIGNVFTQFVEPATRAFQIAAFDGSWQINPETSLYGRADFDVYDRQPTRAEFSIRSMLNPKWTVNAAYTFRSPRLPWNSIFSVFNTEENHEIEAGLYYRYRPTLQFFGNGGLTLYRDDTSLRLTLGANTSWGSFNFVHRSGYAGNLQGVNAYFYRYMKQNKIMPNLQLSWASYKLSAQAANRISLLTGALGLLFRPVKQWALNGQFQLLHNRFYDYDARFLLRIQYWFFTRIQQSTTPK